MKLLALRCPQCAQPLLPDEDEAIVISCENCFTAVSITPHGLQEANIQFAAPITAEISDWLPFWIFQARVHVTERKTQGGSKSVREAAAQFWAVSRRLYVPAWEMPVRSARELGSSLVKKQPQFQAMAPPAETGIKTATVTAEDALKLLEFVVLTLEANRSDWLKSIQFHIEAGPPVLWAIPARQQGANSWQLLAQEENLQP